MEQPFDNKRIKLDLESKDGSGSTALDAQSVSSEEGASRGTQRKKLLKRLEGLENEKSRSEKVAQIISELKEEAHLVEIAGDLLQIHQSQTSSAVSETNWTFNLKLPKRLSIVVHASENDDPNALSARVVAENGLPNGYTEYISKWLCYHLRAERELRTGIAILWRQENADEDRLNSQAHCWQKIVEFLDVKDRIRCEQTSKWIRDLSGSILWHSYRSFDVSIVRPPPDHQLVSGRFTSRPHLKALRDVHNAKWIAAIFDVLKRTEKSLRHLHLSEDLPSSQLPQILRFCRSSLESITLRIPRGPRYPGYVLPASVRFNALQKIRKIDFTTTKIDMHTLTSIPPSVDVLLNLRPTAETDMAPFIQAHQNLTQLDIRQRVKLSFSTLADCCPQLKKLSLSSVLFDIDEVDRLRELTELKLTANAGEQDGYVDADGIADICLNNPHLRVLTLRLSLGMKNHARQAFDAIGSLGSLQEFEASSGSELSAVDDDCVLRLVQGCGRSLISLKVSANLKEVTDRSIDLIGSCCPRLRVLELCSNSALTAAAFRRMINSIVVAPNWCSGMDKLLIGGSVRGVSNGEKSAFLALHNDVSLRYIGVDFRCFAYSFS